VKDANQPHRFAIEVVCEVIDRAEAVRIGVLDRQTFHDPVIASMRTALLLSNALHARIPAYVRFGAFVCVTRVQAELENLFRPKRGCTRAHPQTFVAFDHEVSQKRVC
jgi:hypothetical protein